MDEYNYDDDQQLENGDNYDNSSHNSPHFNNRRNRSQLNSRRNNQRKKDESDNHNRNRQNRKSNTQNNQSEQEKQDKQNNQKEKQDNNTSNNKEDNTSKRNDSTEKKAKVVIKKAIRKIIIIPLIIIALPILLIFMVFIILFSDESNFDGGSNYGSATAGYYPIECEDVTVIFTDKSNNYATTGSGTYSLEDYVAGVIAGEVGQFNNIEVFKEYAIAARTYFLRNESNCTIESSDRKQVFRETSSALAKQAAEETKGQVLLDSNGKPISTEYDAFCSIDKDSNYYTIKQKNQKIPVEWVDKQNGIISEWKQGTCAGNHGRGSSQWGSYYLATERDYNYQQLLNYYYSENNAMTSISSPAFTASIANLDIKTTINASNELSQSIESLLSSKGSSLADYNNYIKQSVEEAGRGTRAGVVAGAVAMINYLYDNFDTKLPYYWGGSYQGVGIPNTFGNNTPSSPSPSGKRYQYKSFDCSGFTSWAVKNAGYKINRLNVTGFDNLVGPSNMCDVTNQSCIGQPGDFISYKRAHIKMIVSVDEPNNRYYVAEATGSGVIITTQGIHERGNEVTSILHMDSFYNNPNNIDTNY